MNPLLPDVYLANFHSHTYRCHHAEGTEEEYILRAIDQGYDCLGFADHTPWPYATDFVSGIRMTVGELDNYIDTLRRLRDKYADRIRIMIGLECEAFPAYFDWLERTKRDRELDYVILGNHYDTTDENNGFYFGQSARPRDLERYAQATIYGMESGLFTYLAHPDLALHRYAEFDSAADEMCRAICEAAQRLNLPLEYNLLGHKRLETAWARGYIGYCSPQFWNVAAQYRVRSIIGVDAHTADALDCVPLYASVREKLGSLGIPVMDVIDGYEK